MKKLQEWCVMTKIFTNRLDNLQIKLENIEPKYDCFYRFYRKNLDGSADKQEEFDR